MKPVHRIVTAVVALSAILTVSASASVNSAGANDSSAVGVYAGFGNNLTRLQEFERELGGNTRWYVTMASRESPGEMRQSVVGQVGGSTNLGSIAGRTNLVITVPLAFGKGTSKTPEGQAAARQRLLETASGKWDDDFRASAQALVAGGYPDAVIRLGHEFTGDFYPWSARGNDDAYIAAFRHVHDVFIKESKSFRFEWNAARNTFGAHGPSAYPGDAYVDVVGLDVYYEPWKGDPAPFTNQVWTDRYASVMGKHRDFAIAHGKPVAYSEWGVGDVEQPEFIASMAGWFSSLPKTGGGRLLYHSYFTPTKDVYDIFSYPRNRAEYFRQFGGVGSGSAPSPATLVKSGTPTVTPPVTTPPTTPPTTRPPTTTPPTTPPPTTPPPTTPPPTTPRPTTPPPVTAPRVAVLPASTAEGKNLGFRVTLSSPTNRPVRVRVQTQNISARAGSDYRARTAVVVIPAGATRIFVGVSTMRDRAAERGETMRLRITSAEGASIATAGAIGTIRG